MIYVFGAILLAVALFLVWLIATERWKFPLLFDCGLALLVFGIAANGIQLASDEAPNLRAWVVAASGAVLMAWSYLRKMRYLKRIDRSKLHHIDGSIMRNR